MSEIPTQIVTNRKRMNLLNSINSIFSARKKEVIFRLVGKRVNNLFELTNEELQLLEDKLKERLRNERERTSG